ncbi:MAG: winged helix-turn-helix domain-containing protein [Armatimonadota bacterium]|nr:winged helix-turn-helix domain-containing protein [Armatimonadota bacterium]
MNHIDNTGVETAFHLLLTEMERAIGEMKRLVNEALQNDDLDAAKQMLSEVEWRKKLISDVTVLQNTWSNGRPTRTGKSVRRRRSTRREGSSRTSHKLFRVPILRALVELGGSAQTRRVLDRVYEMVKDDLTPADLEPLPSEPRSTRWRNAAHWERLAMIRDGLLRKHSPRGIWEITDAGRRWLEQNTAEQPPTV